MNITGIGATGNSASAAASASLSDTFDTFLTLLTTQLQNQDPLDPMDSAQFTEQLVQFTEVEQSIATNKNLESVLGLMLAEQTSAAVSYIGKDIEALSRTTLLTDGKAVWKYGIESDADRTSITITDADGKLVYATTGETDAGVHEFVWDGKDNSGETLPDGTYTIDVSAVDADGNSIGVGTSIVGRVTGVQSIDGLPVLLVGDGLVELSNVIKVTEPQSEG